MSKFYFVIIYVLLCNCSAKELSPEDLQAFILNEENGLLQVAEMNGTQLSVVYRPTDIWVHQEIDEGLINKNCLDSLRRKYSDYYYFILSISKSDEEALHMVGEMTAYSELVETMSFRMHQYVNLTTASHDTIPVSDFILNRTYGLGSSSDILFAFNREKTKDDKWIQINLSEFGLGLGNQRFRFPVKVLEEVPRLHFKVAR